MSILCEAPDQAERRDPGEVTYEKYPVLAAPGPSEQQDILCLGAFAYL